MDTTGFIHIDDMVRPKTSAQVAFARLMVITGHDRIRCRDGRYIWWRD